jgi:hypothetical protein
MSVDAAPALLLAPQRSSTSLLLAQAAARRCLDVVVLPPERIQSVFSEYPEETSYGLAKIGNARAIQSQSRRGEREWSASRIAKVRPATGV